MLLKIARENAVADAGGSWVALHEDGNAAVRLNGAFDKHVISS